MRMNAKVSSIALLGGLLVACSARDDEVLKSKFDLSIITQLAAKEASTVQSCESELKQLAELPGTPTQLQPRIRYLLDKAAASQDKIVKYEAKAARLKKILSEKY